MQPDIPSSQPPAHYTPLSTPDYLGMTPVAEVSQRPKRRFKIVLIIIALIVAIGLVAVGYWFWWQGTSEQRLYRALEQHIRSDYTNQEYSFKFKTSGMNLIAHATTDLSAPRAPRDSFGYSLSVRSSNGKDEKIQGEGVNVGEGGVRYVRIISASSLFANKKVSQNQWYQVNSSDKTTLSFFDPMNIRSATALDDLLPTGGVDNAQLAEVMRLIQTVNPYKIVFNETAAIDNGQASVLTVDIDGKKMTAINRKILESQGVTGADKTPTVDDVKNIKLWIDQRTGKILKIVVPAKGDLLMSETTLTYPTEVGINMPVGAAQLSLSSR